MSVIESQLENGWVVHTATLNEMPGIVAEGSSERIAVSEMIALC